MLTFPFLGVNNVSFLLEVRLERCQFRFTYLSLLKQLPFIYNVQQLYPISIALSNFAILKNSIMHIHDAWSWTLFLNIYYFKLYSVMCNSTWNEDEERCKRYDSSSAYSQFLSYHQAWTEIYLKNMQRNL